MATLFGVLFALTQLYVFVLLVRVILDILSMLARDWRPTGVALLLVNLVYRVTDPPLRFLAKYIPPLRLGPVAFDMGFIVLLVIVNILGRVFLVLQ